MIQIRTHAEADRRTDKIVAGLAVLAAAAGALAELWPAVALCLLLVLSLGLVIALRAAEAAQAERMDDADTIWSADDSHLADVAREGDA